MARIAGVNIPTNKRVEIALTYIHGIGRSKARQITEKLGIGPEKRVQDLTARLKANESRLAASQRRLARYAPATALAMTMHGTSPAARSETTRAARSSGRTTAIRSSSSTGKC